MKQELVTIKCGNQEIQGTVCHEEMKLGIEQMLVEYPKRQSIKQSIKDKIKEVDFEYEYTNEILLDDDENDVDDLFYVQYWTVVQENQRQKNNNEEVDNVQFEELYYNYLLQKYFGLTTLENDELGKIEKENTQLVTTNKVYKMIRKGTKGRTPKNPRKIEDIHNVPWEFCRMNKKIYGRVSDTKGKYGGLGFGGQIGIDWMEMTRITDIQNGWTEWDEREFDYDKMFIVESKLNQLVQTCRSLGLTDKQITGIHVGETEDDMGYKFRKLSLDQLKDPIFMKEWIDNGCGKNDDNEDYKTVKIGRNDKCICGSGKKFKRCCLN